MPEIKAIKSKPAVNNFDFNFFSDNKGRRGKTTKVAIPKEVEGKLVDGDLLFKF